MQFEATLARAETLKLVAAKFVSKTLNSQRTKSLPEALRDPVLQNACRTCWGRTPSSKLRWSIPIRMKSWRTAFPNGWEKGAGPYPDFRDLVNRAPWYEKWQVLRGSDRQLYQLEEALGTPPISRCWPCG